MKLKFKKCTEDTGSEDECSDESGLWKDAVRQKINQEKKKINDIWEIRKIRQW